MGWRGTLRSMAAASRAADRAAQRRRKDELKAEMAADAAAAVSEWEEYLDNLVSVHTTLTDAIDWHSIAARPIPTAPVLGTNHQDMADADLTSFTPRFWDFLVGGSSRRQKRLENAQAQASALDHTDYENAVAKFDAELTEWQDEAGFAQKLIAGDHGAIREVVGEILSLANDGRVLASLSLSYAGSIIHAQAEVLTDEVVPKVRRKQLASGKLSETKMPAGQFNELYQDYVASIAFWVAGNLLQILPFNEIYVTCATTMLNTQTGHQELTPILSVQFVRETFKRLNLDAIDPSDALSNFNHAMKFRKTKGFEAVEALAPMENSH